MSELKEVEYPNIFGSYYYKCEADKVIAEKDEEIAELKKKLEAKEIEFAILKADAINTDTAREKWLELARKQAMENKRLSRALYKACANWVHEKDARYYLKYVCISDDALAEYKRWENVERKCRAKADEYK